MTYEARLNAKSARILVGPKVVGRLDKIATDEYRFTYDELYRKASDNVPMSLSLPLTVPRVETKELPAFFDNLLMEGRLVRRLGKEHGLDTRNASDRFKLLMLCSFDTIGGISILPLDNNGLVIENAIPERIEVTVDHSIPLTSAYDNHCPICLKPGSLHPGCSINLISSKSPMSLSVKGELTAESFRTIPAGSSISGAQDKNLFKVKKGCFLPELPSTHIIKPEGDFLEMPANEHLTMTIAKRVNFNVPVSGLFRVEGLGLIYIIKRFDRQASGARILLEDFAQILNCQESDKEEGTMESIALAIDKYCSSPLVEKSDFFRRIIFSFIFGNGDMHLKNWSLIYDSKIRLYKMSPVYDWLNVRASMPSEKVEMILPIAGKRIGFERLDFEVFGKKTLKINEKFIQKTFQEIPEWTSTAKKLCAVSALSEKMKANYLKIIEERSERMG